MNEDYILNTLKPEYSRNVIYTVCVDDKYNVIGMVTLSQVKEAAKFVREKYKKEPLFYHYESFGWIRGKRGKRYEIVD